MKRGLLVLLLFALKLNAQVGFTNHIGATWYFGYNGWAAGGGVIERKYTNDTIIHNTTYRVLTDLYYKQTYIFPNNVPTPVLDTIIPWGKMILKVSGDSVFWYSSQNDTTYMLYNFNAQIGDEWDIYPAGYGVCPYSRVKVINIGTEVISGVSCRWINLAPVDSSGYSISGKINERFGSKAYQWLPLAEITCDTSIHIDTNVIVDYDVFWFNCFSDNIIDYHTNNNQPCNNLTSILEDVSATNTFTLYPNPACNTINLQTNYTKVYQITIYDMAGKLLLTENRKTGNYALDISALNSGIYLLQIITAEGLVSKKLIVE